MNKIFLFLLSMIFFNCRSFDSSTYFEKDFTVNQIKSCFMGSVIISVECGKRGDFSGEKVSGVREELIYNGIVNNTLNLIFREYFITEDRALIRASFTFQLTYDLSISKVIIFRNTAIEILIANSQGISFVVKRFNKNTCFDGKGIL